MYRHTVLAALALAVGVASEHYCVCENRNGSGSGQAATFKGIGSVCSKTSPDWCTTNCDAYGDNCDVCHHSRDTTDTASIQELRNWCNSQVAYDASTDTYVKGGQLQCYETPQESMETTECTICNDCNNQDNATGPETPGDGAIVPLEKPAFSHYDVEGPNIIGSKIETLIRQEGMYALYKVTQVDVVGYDWEHVFNEQTGKYPTLTYTMQFPRGLTVHGSSRGEGDNQEPISRDISSGLEAEGISVRSAGSTQHKTFSAAETSPEAPAQRSFLVGPDPAAAGYYQRVFHFRTTEWYKLDADRQWYTVGRWRAPGVALRAADFSIRTDDFVMMHDMLDASGSGVFTTDGVDPADDMDNVIRFEDMPREVQSYLHDRGV